MIFAVVGTRPEVVKMAPVVAALKRRRHPDARRRDRPALQLADDGFVPRDLRARGRPPARLEQPRSARQLRRDPRRARRRCSPPQRRGLVLAVGDTTTVLAAAFAARKTGSAFGHVESRPARVLARAARRGAPDLRRCARRSAVRADPDRGREPRRASSVNGRVILTGNTVLDALTLASAGARGRSASGVLVTLHRQETVDDPGEARPGPRRARSPGPQPRGHRGRSTRAPSRRSTRPASCSRRRSRSPSPVGHTEFLALLARRTSSSSRDSGGVQEEAAILGTPCVTVRNNTERPETIAEGVGLLARHRRRRRSARSTRSSAIGRRSRVPCPHLYGDGRAGEKIAHACAEWLAARDSRLVVDSTLPQRDLQDRCVKICMVVPYDLAEEGGVKRHGMQLAASLRRLGDEVDVIGPCWQARDLGPSTCTVSAAWSTSQQRLRQPPRHLRVPVARCGRCFASAATTWSTSTSRCSRRSTTTRCWSAGRARRASGRSTRSWSTRAPRSCARGASGPRSRFRSYDRGIAVSPAAARVRAASTFKKPLAIIPNGIRTALYPRGARRAAGAPLKLLFVGHWRDSRKGLPCLLDACTRLRARGVAWTLDIVGDGGQRPRSRAARRATITARSRRETSIAELYAGVRRLRRAVDRHGVVRHRAARGDGVGARDRVLGYRRLPVRGRRGPDRCASSWRLGRPDGARAARSTALAADPAARATHGRAESQARPASSSWDRLVARVRDEYFAALGAARRYRRRPRRRGRRPRRQRAGDHDPRLAGCSRGSRSAARARAARPRDRRSPGSRSPPKLSLQTDLAELLPAARTERGRAPRAEQARRWHRATSRSRSSRSTADRRAARVRAAASPSALTRSSAATLLLVRYSRNDVVDYYQEVRRVLRQGWTTSSTGRSELSAAAAKQNPAYVELDDARRARSARSPTRCARRATSCKPRNPADATTGLYMTENGHLAVVFVRPAANSLNLGGRGGNAPADRGDRRLDQSRAGTAHGSPATPARSRSRSPRSMRSATTS